MSFQTLSGRRNCVSLSQEIGATCSVAIRVGVEDRAAEQEKQRDVAVREAVEIFRGRDIEIEGAGTCRSTWSLPVKARDHDAGVSPQQGAKGLAPAFRLAEEIAQAFPDPRRYSAGG